MFDVRLTATQESWLADLYQAHAPAVLKLCRRYTVNAQDAADACQEVFLRAATSHAATFPAPPAGEGEGGGPNYRSWLLTVARNYCLDQIRRQKRFNTAITRMGLDAPPETDPEASVVDRDMVDAIFRQLSERERNVLWQSAVEHRPLAEIAGRLHLNYMAAGQVVSRARKRASMLAAKVAAIFIGFRLITRRVNALPVKLMAAAVVPVAALSVQSSSSTLSNQSPNFAGPAATARHSSANVSGSSSSSSAARSEAAAPNSTLPGSAPLVSVPPIPGPSAIGGSAGSIIDTLRKVIPPLPLPSPSALPTPSLPPPPPIP